MERIFYNGIIITMEAKDANDESLNEPEAILVKDGIIDKVGALLDIEKYADKNVVKTNLNGKCLMPSFIDSHSHFVMNGQMSIMVDLSECKSFDDIVISLKKYIENNKITKNDAVIGFGYDHNFLRESAHPDKRTLDRVSIDIPIFILHVSAHLACANSSALYLAGIDKNMVNPDGGVIGRFENSDEPNGYVEEAALALLQTAIMPRIKFNIESSIRKMQDEYLKNGITTVQDGASTESDLMTLIYLSESDHLKLDVISYPLMSSGGIDLMRKYGDKYTVYQKHLKIGGYKLVLDGSPQGRSAWMSEPYLGGEIDYKGYAWLEDDMVYHYVKKAVIEKKQLLAHCNGDAASEQFLSIYKQVLENIKIKEDLRPVMIHCQTVRNDQLDKMAELSMIASIFIGHVWYWGDIHMKNFGIKRGNHISPAKDAIDRGVVVDFHQDTPVTKPNMLHSVWCAVNRISRNGHVIGKDQIISVYDALKAVTINAAYQYFEENAKGSIKEGKRADLVILDRSPLDVDKMKIKDINVIETIKDGMTIYNG